jgi:hypothetical protein
MTWEGQVARMKGFWWEIQKERDNYEDLDVGGKVVLK